MIGCARSTVASLAVQRYDRVFHENMTHGSMNTNVARGALSHVRVLDMSRVLAGPWAGQILADLGAEVIKIERPGVGDDTRAWGPPYLKDEQGADTAESAYFLGANRGKKSVTLDISKAEGQELVRKLAAQSDILLENYKAGDLQRYGLGYEQLRAAHQSRLDLLLDHRFWPERSHALGGRLRFHHSGHRRTMSITGGALTSFEQAAANAETVWSVVDIATGMYSTVAILAALAHRSRTGEGQYIDMALLTSRWPCWPTST